MYGARDLSAYARGCACASAHGGGVRVVRTRRMPLLCWTERREGPSLGQCARHGITLLLSRHVTATRATAKPMEP